MVIMAAGGRPTDGEITRVAGWVFFLGPLAGLGVAYAAVKGMAQAREWKGMRR
jgi:hypothetical protein